jgi:hypothetical protein
MYHGVDFWKIVAWVKDELAARLNSFVQQVGLKLEDLAADYWQWRFSIDASQPKGCRSRSTSAASRSLWLLAGNFSSRMWSIHGHTHSARFAEIWIASLAPTFLVGYQFALTEADSFPSARRAAIPPFAVFRPRPVLPPGTGRPSSGPSGNGAGSDRHEALQSTSVGSPVVEHKTDGDSPQRPSVSQPFR